MRTISIHKITAAAALGFALIVGAGDASAQGRNKVVKQQGKIIKQQQKVEKQTLKLEQERLRLERERLQAQQTRNNRFRVYRNGSVYNTNQRGADLLKRAVNEGYRQGLQAGQADRRNRRSMNWAGSSLYRSGTVGYQSYVDRGQYQYYFQQGFQRGYQDGFNSRNQFGTNSGGGINILASILNQLLDVRQY